MAGPAYPNTYRNVSGSTPNTSKSNAKFSRTINTTGITFYATSSTTNGNRGLIVNSSRAVSDDSTIYFLGGGTIMASNLTTGSVYPFSVSKISGSADINLLY